MRISWVFPLIILAANAINFFIAYKVTDWQLTHFRKHVLPDDRRMQYFQGVFGNRINQQTIQTGRLFPYFSGLFSKWNKSTMWNCFKLNYYCLFSEAASVLIMGIVYLGSAYFIGMQVINGTVDIGFFAMVIVLLVNLFFVMKEHIHFLINHNWFVRIITDYYDVIDTCELAEEVNIINDNANKPFKEITLRNLRYKYPQSNKHALNDVSFSFKAGERIAIVGHNGSGKTTMTGILLGLLRDFTGEIILDESSSENNYIGILSNSIASLQQDFVHYQLSVRQNIELGNRGIPLPDGKIIEILKTVGLYDDVASLKNGIDTPLGQLEKGVELSKGQWQKLAVARLLANENAKIWILDEPTAYLDPLAEIEMYDFIYKLVKKQTVFFISHRLGFARRADKIIVFDGGNIAEQGNHDSLMERKGLYYEMYKTQQSWYT